MAHYEVDADLIVRIWDSEARDSDPYIYQPYHPNGSPWLSAADAEDWAKDFLGLVEPVSPEEGTDPILVAEEE